MVIRWAELIQGQSEINLEWMEIPTFIFIEMINKLLLLNYYY